MNKIVLNGVIYKIENSEAFVYGLEDIAHTYNVTITEMVQGYPVTEIKHQAFWNSNLRAIVLPQSIIAIDDSAFDNCRKLIEVHQLGQHQKKAITISSCAFHNCVKLRTIIFARDMLLVGERQFAGCKTLKMLPAICGDSSFKKYAFHDCVKLEQLTFVGSKYMMVDDDAFINCPKLRKFIFCCKVIPSQYLLQLLYNAVVFVNPEAEAMLDLVYDGYDVRFIPT